MPTIEMPTIEEIVEFEIGQEVFIDHPGDSAIENDTYEPGWAEEMGDVIGEYGTVTRVGPGCAWVEVDTRLGNYTFETYHLIASTPVRRTPNGNPPALINRYHHDNVLRHYGFGESEIAANGNKYYIGVEMEYECRGTDRRDAAYHITDQISGWAILMHDGSLSNGFEIISYPTSLNDLVGKFRDMFKQRLSSNIGLVTRKNTGLHINISKCAWDSNYALAVANIVINNYHELTNRVAGRDSTDYCRKEYKDEEDALSDAEDGNDKYTAMHIKEEVAEIRAFRATTTLEKLRDRLAYCRMLVDYGNYCDERDVLPSYSDLKTFINSNRKHSRLLKYMD